VPGASLLPASPELAQRLARNRGLIEQKWVRALREKPASRYAELPSRDLVTWTGRGLDAVIESLSSGSPTPVERHADHVSEVRQRLGFSIGEVVSGILCLEPAVLHCLSPEWKGDPSLAIGEMSALSACVRAMVAHFAETFAQSARAAVERNLQESRLLHQISTALLEKSGLTGMLSLVCRECRRMTGAEGCAAMLTTPDGTGLRVAVRDGAEAAEADRFVHDSLMGGQATGPVEPVVFDDVAATPSTSPAGRLGSVAAVPLRIEGRLVGALELVKTGVPFTDADLRVLSRIADQTAVAIDHERLLEQQQTKRVLEERHRLARDLHDSVTQSIYGVTMFAEAAGRLLRSGDTTAVAQYLSEVLDAARHALWELRLMVFELRPPNIRSEGLVAMLQTRLAAVESRAGLEAEFDCGHTGRLPDPVEEGLYRIAQEAISNAIRHSGASKISLRLSCTESHARLEFADNGQGFELTEGLKKGGLGLRGILERADSLGGQGQILTHPGGGTRIVVEVPVERQAVEAVVSS
jgi:signal transduction histidine kinase